MSKRKPKGFWTDERIQAEALQFQTRKAFQKGSPSAYQLAHRKRILDSVCQHMAFTATNWTEQALLQEALKYDTRGAFREGSSKAYGVAHKRGLLDRVCGHMSAVRRNYSDEELRAEALKFNSRGLFKEGNNSAYRAAIQRGLLDTICRHMTAGQTKWTDEKLREEAAKYTNRADFKRSGTAYSIALSRGILDDICGHMERLSGDFDAIYIWRHVGAKHRRRSVYKIGVTSARLGDQRINLCTNKNGMEAELVILADAQDALKLEKQILEMGIDPGYPSEIDGYTEFRAFTARELERATRLIEQAA